MSTVSWIFIQLNLAMYSILGTYGVVISTICRKTCGAYTSSAGVGPGLLWSGLRTATARFSEFPETPFPTPLKCLIEPIFFET